MRRVKVSYRFDPVTIAAVRGVSTLTRVPQTWIIEEAVLCFNLGLSERKAKEYLKNYEDYGSVEVKDENVVLV